VAYLSLSKLKKLDTTVPGKLDGLFTFGNLSLGLTKSPSLHFTKLFLNNNNILKQNRDLIIQMLKCSLVAGKLDRLLTWKPNSSV
jgi:hypothetical protein